MSHMFRRTGMAVLVGALLMSISSVAARAQTPEQHYRCERRIRRAEANLQRAIDRHGTNSRQAERRRRELAEARAQCQGM